MIIKLNAEQFKELIVNGQTFTDNNEEIIVFDDREINGESPLEAIYSTLIQLNNIKETNDIL